jgi:hypothetical protein
MLKNLNNRLNLNLRYAQLLASNQLKSKINFNRFQHSDSKNRDANRTPRASRLLQKFKRIENNDDNDIIKEYGLFLQINQKKNDYSPSELDETYKFKLETNFEHIKSLPTEILQKLVCPAYLDQNDAFDFLNNFYKSIYLDLKVGRLRYILHRPKNMNLIFHYHLLVNLENKKKIKFLRKFVENNQNWSIIFKNIDMLQSYAIQKLNSDNKASFNHILDKNLLFNATEWTIVDFLNKQHFKLYAEFGQSIGPSFNENLLSRSKLIFDLINSLESYMIAEFKTKTRLESDFNFMAEVLRVKFMHCEIRSFFEKDFINKSEYCKNLEQKVNQLMRFYPNFVSMPSNYKDFFVYYFGFFRKKFLNICNNYLFDENIESNFVDENGQFGLLNICINGSLNLNSDLEDEEITKVQSKLLRKITDLKVKKNLNHNFQENKFSYNFCHLNELKNDKSIEFLLQTWNTLEYLPVKPIIKKMKSKLENNSAWKLKWVPLSELNSRIKPKIYDKKALKIVSDTLRESILSENFFTKEKLKNLQIIDDIIDQDFKFIIDGLNIYYLTNNHFLENLKHLFNLVKHEKCLVVIRKHVNIRLIDLSKMPNIRFLITEDCLEDDKFLLYAALRSENRTYIISNDLYSNHHNIIYNEHGYLFKRWLQNSLVEFTPYDGLIFPPRFDLKVQKLTDNPIEQEWLIPCIDFKNERETTKSYYILKKVK